VNCLSAETPISVREAAFAANLLFPHRVRLRHRTVFETNQAALKEDGALPSNIELEAQLAIDQIQLACHGDGTALDQRSVWAEIDQGIGVVGAADSGGLCPPDESVIALAGEKSSVNEQSDEVVHDARRQGGQSTRTSCTDTCVALVHRGAPDRALE